MDQKELIELKATLIQVIQRLTLKDVNRYSMHDDIMLMDSDEYHLSLRIK